MGNGDRVDNFFVTNCILKCEIVALIKDSLYKIIKGNKKSKIRLVVIEDREVTSRPSALASHKMSLTLTSRNFYCNGLANFVPPDTCTGLTGESIRGLNEQTWTGVTALPWLIHLLHGLMVLPLIIFLARSTGPMPSWTRLRS